ncbi:MULTISPECIES: hypothetical protein [Pseudomonas]|uniref:hypothetical protein n=1 Tax=Pseudomonas TaxID=286 RepID=UPI000761ECAC|nr:MULTISPECIES: hypothetical protein [Pseudomonas]MDG9809482.1 hypothetical protein [Pseudomonas juntendi]MDG9815839.1 hypothetical protein [Pseudomonas putida]
MQVTEVTANLTGLFHCPSCSTANGDTALAAHGIDYVGKKCPDDKRLAYCTACGYAMVVDYPVGARLPRNLSHRWEPCEECGGNYKHHNGNEPCERCQEGGWWVEDTGEPTIAELIGERAAHTQSGVHSVPIRQTIKRD